MSQAAVGDLADVNKAIALAEKVHEGAEIHQFDDLSGVDLSRLGISRNRHDHFTGLFDLRKIGAGDLDQTVVVDIDLCPGRLDDFANDLAAGPDDLADLFGIDLD